MTGNATAINVGVDSMRPEFSSTEAGQAFRKAGEVLENASPPRPAGQYVCVCGLEHEKGPFEYKGRCGCFIAFHEHELFLLLSEVLRFN